MVLVIAVFPGRFEDGITGRAPAVLSPQKVKEFLCGVAAFRSTLKGAPVRAIRSGHLRVSGFPSARMFAALVAVGFLPFADAFTRVFAGFQRMS